MAQSKDEYAFELAKEAIEALKPVYLVERDEIQVPDNGLLESQGEVKIRHFLETKAYSENNIALYQTVLHHVKARCAKSLNDFIQPSNYVNVRNGVYNVTEDHFWPHDENRLFLEQFPVYYDPKARCPQFLKVFKDIVPDPQSRFEILRSWAVCFDKTPLKRESELWIGDFDTGKTTLLNVLRVLLGSKNHASMSLQQLTDSQNQFILAHLAFKAANIYDDLTSIEIKEVGPYKALLGGSSINARFIYGKPFEFAPYAKFFFACNKPPLLLDQILLDDMAFFERFKIRYFNEKVRKERQDQALTNLLYPEEGKITNSREISGIFNILMGILRSVRHWQDWGYSLDAKVTKELWMNEIASSDSVSRFLNEKVVVVEGDSTPVAELWEAWEAWRKLNKVSPISPTQFNERVEKVSYQRRGRKARSWVNIVLKGVGSASLDTTQRGMKDGIDGLDNAFPRSNRELYVQKYNKKPVLSDYDILGKNFLSNGNGLRSWFANPLMIAKPQCQKQDCVMYRRKFQTVEAYFEHVRLIHEGGLLKTEKTENMNPHL